MKSKQSKREAGVIAAAKQFERDHALVMKSKPVVHSCTVPKITETEYEINYQVTYFDYQGRRVGVIDYRYDVL